MSPEEIKKHVTTIEAFLSTSKFVTQPNFFVEQEHFIAQCLTLLCAIARRLGTCRALCSRLHLPQSRGTLEE